MTGWIVPKINEKLSMKTPDRQSWYSHGQWRDGDTNRLNSVGLAICVFLVWWQENALNVVVHRNYSIHKVIGLILQKYNL